MATEKTWAYSQNVDCNGEYADVASSCGTWMYNLFTMLSGGNGNSTSKWEIISASNSTAVAAGGTNITGAGNFIWSSSGAHSWFTARKDTLLPQTGSGGRYVYMTVDCEDTNPYKAYFAFDHEINTSAGSTTARPTVAGTEYAKDAQQFLDNTYDAGLPHYFHGIIDTTGSFHAFYSKSGLSYEYPFAISCARLETPRTGTVDPYPVMLKLGYYNHASYQGPWDMDNMGNFSLAGAWNTATPGTYGTSQAMWEVGSGIGAAEGMAGRAANDYTMATCNISTGTVYTYWGSSGWKASGDSIDASWGLTPIYFYDNFVSQIPDYVTLKGRLPDVHFASNYWDYGGSVMPGTGTIQYCWVGQCWFPATASLLPGSA
tara:strand:+ start:279 stop:1397 length:1119 start_codon:yes stop_codon:yes gene_type:complete